MAESKKPIYKVETKRDAKMVKSFVLFTFRQRHPNATRNFLIVGVVSLALTIGIRMQAFGIFLTVQGLFCLFMGLFRHWFPIMKIKGSDPDYLAGNTLTYEFYGSRIIALRNGEEVLRVNSYDKVGNLCHDEDYYYLGANEEDLMILPKDAFVTGDADSFEDFIEKKAKIKAVWSPATYGEKKKKNKAEAGEKAEKRRAMQEASMAEMRENREYMRQALAKRREEKKAAKEAAAKEK